MIPLLHLEVPPERITFMEEVGRGAFGKVHRGALKELPTVEIFEKPRDQRVEIKEAKMVAIKTLLGEQKHNRLPLIDPEGQTYWAPSAVFYFAALQLLCFSSRAGFHIFGISIH